MQTWELKCPHCGGPNAVAADRSCLACQFCGAGLWVKLPHDYTTLVSPAKIKKREAVFAWDRHLKDAGLPLSQSPREGRLLYLPFWRVTAVVAVQESTEPKAERLNRDWGTFDAEGFSSQRDRETVHDDTDVLLGDWSIKPWETTVPAFADGISHLDSLGMRGETAPLTGWDRVPATEEPTRAVLTVTGAEALARLKPAIVSVLGAGGRLIEELRIIAPSLSLIYWPVWQLAELHSNEPLAVEIDAVSGRILSAHPGPLPEIASERDDPGHSPSLCPHRCLTCGADLPITDQFVVFVCGNCRSLTVHAETGQRHIVEADFTQPTSAGELNWYPFWSFGGGRTLVPAFGIRSQRHRLRLGVMMSGSRRATHQPLEHPRHLAGATLGPEVALGLSQIIIERGAPVRATGVQNLTGDSQDSASPRLIYAPMQTVGRELVDPVTGLCISGSVITASKS